MKQILTMLVCFNLAYAMQDSCDEIMLTYKQRQRDIFFNEVALAHTQQGLDKAYDLFFDLSDKHIIPGITSVWSRAFYHDHASQYPDIAHVIVRLHNCVIKKALEMAQDGNQIEKALHEMRSSGPDRGYIISGQKVPIDENQFLTKMTEIAATIKNFNPGFGVIDE